MLPSIESIKQQRLKINMTQKELANLVGVSTSMINQIESGRSQPSYETAKKIFEILTNKENQSVWLQPLKNLRTLKVSASSP